MNIDRIPLFPPMTPDPTPTYDFIVQLLSAGKPRPRIPLFYDLAACCIFKKYSGSFSQMCTERLWSFYFDYFYAYTFLENSTFGFSKV